MRGRNWRVVVRVPGMLHLSSAADDSRGGCRRSPGWRHRLMGDVKPITECHWVRKVRHARSAVMGGNLVAKVTTLCYAEPGDLYATRPDVLRRARRQAPLAERAEYVLR